jgi:hypothetical protein
LFVRLGGLLLVSALSRLAVLGAGFAGGVLSILFSVDHDEIPSNIFSDFNSEQLLLPIISGV